MQFNFLVTGKTFMKRIFMSMAAILSLFAGSSVQGKNIESEYILLRGKGNPRNSEGSFVKLADGTILFAYTRYNGSAGNDHSSADIAAVTSKDNGKTWSKPLIILKNRAMNIMSVSLLRLNNNKIAMTYLKKSAVPGRKNFIDCRPEIVFSGDECRTWSEPIEITGVPAAYFVLNNDRLVQLKSGRLIFPVAHHSYVEKKMLSDGVIKFFISDDNGKTWRLGKHYIYPTKNSMRRGLMEPGVVELKNGKLMCFMRTSIGYQYKSFSEDGGESWTTAEAALEFRSPESPLSVKRNPANGKLYAVWNDHSNRKLIPVSSKFRKRSPLVIAESSDEGVTWTNHQILEKSENHGFCYTAMYFDGPLLYLGYCCGGKPHCQTMLDETKLRVLKLQ